MGAAGCLAPEMPLKWTLFCPPVPLERNYWFAFMRASGNMRGASFCSFEPRGPDMNTGRALQWLASMLVLLAIAPAVWGQAPEASPYRSIRRLGEAPRLVVEGQTASLALSPNGKFVAALLRDVNSYAAKGSAIRVRNRFLSGEELADGVSQTPGRRKHALILHRHVARRRCPPTSATCSRSHAATRGGVT